VLLAEGRPAEARAAAAEGLKLIDRTLDQGGAEAETDLLQELLRLSEAASNSGTDATDSV
jgi:hypothetical protein